MASSALVTAFLSVRNVFPPAELNENLEKCTQAFRDIKDPTGKDFRELHYLFVALLHGGNMPRDRDWFSRARLWRLLLLQNRNGSWSLTRSLAMALLARPELAADCPLSFDESEICRSLDECERAGGLAGAADKESVWATSLVVAYLQTCQFSWLADGESNFTIVDRGLEWLSANGHSDTNSKVAQFASEKVARWAEIQDECVGRIRDAERKSDHHFSGIFQHFVGAILNTRDRAPPIFSSPESSEALTFAHLPAHPCAGEVVRLVRIEHESFGWLMAPVAVDLFRWQQFMSLCSMLIALLVVVRPPVELQRHWRRVSLWPPSV